jgi:hypothetical protein
MNRRTHSFLGELTHSQESITNDPNISQRPYPPIYPAIIITVQHKLWRRQTIAQVSFRWFIVLTAKGKTINFPEGNIQNNFMPSE